MELTLTALIKAIILHWWRGRSSGDKQLENAPAPPPSFYVSIDLLSTVP